MVKREADKRLEKLRREINKHRYLYHVLDAPEISDAALDSLKRELDKIEKKFPDLITPDSPSQRVGGKALDKFEKVRHKSPMLSLNDVFSKEEAADWLARIQKIVPGAKIDFFCEYKMDGFAVSVVYKNGVLITGATRGDGQVGENVTQNLRTVESIPLKLEIHDKKSGLAQDDLSGEIEIRGEVYMDKKDFEKINRQRKKAGEPLYANPRNTAAGSIRQLDPKIAAGRNLKFMAYSLVSDLGQKTHAREHEVLRSLGFKSDKGFAAKSLKDLARFHESVGKKRGSFFFEIDGIVVNVNDEALFKKMGVVGKAPRGAVAFKFHGKEATTMIKDIVAQVGRTGVLTPVAILEPVEVGGVTISRASLHNQDEIDRLDARIGDTVVVRRAGDVIPDVVRSFPNLRAGREKKFHMPPRCPVCGSKVTREEGKAAHRCSNRNCGAILRRNLYHFASKKAFDIAGLGPQRLDQLMDEGLVKDAADIFELGEGDLAPLERFGEKSAKNLVEAISKKRTITLPRFIFSLGIARVGEETAIDLARHFGYLNKLQRASQDDLMEVKDIGPVAAKSIAEWFGGKKNRDFLMRLKKAGVRTVKEASRKKKKAIVGKTFIFTGELAGLSRDGAKDLVRNAGGEVVSSVSVKTDFAVAGGNPGSKLNKAKKMGVKILSEKEFLKIIK